jgi:hypothetical protein
LKDPIKNINPITLKSIPSLTKMPSSVLIDNISCMTPMIMTKTPKISRNTVIQHKRCLRIEAWLELLLILFVLYKEESDPKSEKL